MGDIRHGNTGMREQQETGMLEPWNAMALGHGGAPGHGDTGT